MPQILTIDRFNVGLDVRKGPGVADANRLRTLTNAVVTTGNVIRSRPGLVLVATLESGTTGLVAGKTTLETFYATGTVTHANTLFNPRKVPHDTDPAQTLARVHVGDIVAGYVYVSVEYANGDILHHYLDGTSPSHIADANCPNTASWVKAVDKIWAVGDEVVRYSAVSAPRDWTTPSDAGFLPVGRQAQGAVTPTGVTNYKSLLGVTFADSVQLWTIDPDPLLNTLAENFNGFGTRFPGSARQLAQDLILLTNSGVRAITATGAVDGVFRESDIGSPIDDILRPLARSAQTVRSTFFQAGGQYIIQIDTNLYVYTFSRTDKISAWSKWELPFSPDAFAELNGDLYVRHGNSVYRFDEDVDTDYGLEISGQVKLPYLSAQRPGALKQWMGMDMVLDGTANVQFLDNPDDESVAYPAVPIEVTGDTRRDGMTPIEICSTELGVDITFTAPFRLDMLQLYFEDLGPL